MKYSTGVASAVMHAKFYSRTSPNGNLSTTATLFCLGGQSIHLLLFIPLYNGE